MSLTWVGGGAALIAVAVLRIVHYRLVGLIPVGELQTVALVADGVMAVGLITLAVGLRREDSVVGRRPGGVTAVSVFAVLPLLSGVVDSVLPGIDDAGYNLEAMRAAETAGAWSFLVSIVLTLILATLSAAAVAGARSVPPPWNWTPFWALGLFILLGGSIFFIPALTFVWWLNSIAPPLLLGVVILLLGLHRPVLDGGDLGTERSHEQA